MATSVELDMNLARSKRDQYAETSANGKTDVDTLETGDERDRDRDRDRRRENYTRFPPVSYVTPNNTAQRQRQTTKTSDEQPRRTVPHDDELRHEVVKTASSANSNNCVRYELPARPAIHRLNAVNEQHGSVHQSQHSGDNYSTTKYTMIDGVEEKQTIFNREPVPYSTGQFKFSSMMKKMPINRRDWSHYSPLLNRYRAFVVHANRQSLKLNTYQQVTTDRGRSHPLREYGVLESKSDYLHCSRQLKLPSVTGRTTESHHHITPMLESDLNLVETESESDVNARNEDHNNSEDDASSGVDLPYADSRVSANHNES